MRGIVVTGLREYIEDKYSLITWEKILQATGQEELYISTADFYADEIAIEMVVAAAQQTQVELPLFIEQFGRHLFHTLKEYYGFSIMSMSSLDELLHSLDDVIHPQIKKLHADAIVPKFRVVNVTDGWQVFYQSERKLCPLAIGLIYGAADHYNETIDISLIKSMIDGHKESEFHVKRS